MALQIRRGLQADLPSTALDGELLYATDTGNLYVGVSGAPVLVTGGAGQQEDLVGADSDWVLARIAEVAFEEKADSDWVARQLSATSATFQSNVQQVVNNLVESGNLVDSEFVQRVAGQTTDAIQADSEWISQQINTVYDPTSTTYQNLVDALNADTNVKLGGADSDWVVSQIAAIPASTIDSDFVIRSAANVAVSGADSDWVQRLIDGLEVNGADSDWVVNSINQVYDPTSTTYQNLVDALQADTSVNLGGADSDWILEQITANSPSPEADSDWIVSQINTVYDPTSTTYQNLVDALQADTTVNLGGADSDWILEQITTNSPSPEADSDWIVSQVNTVYDPTSTTYQNLVNALEADTNVNLGGGADSDWVLEQITANSPSPEADSEWIVNQVNTVYDPTSNTYQNLVDSLKADTTINFDSTVDSEYVQSLINAIPAGSIDSDWVIRSAQNVAVTGADSDWVQRLIDGLVINGADSDWVVNSINSVYDPTSTTYQNLVNALRTDTNVNIDGADSEWINNQVNSVYDPTSTTYQNLVDALQADTTVNLGGADSDWVLEQISANAPTPAADSDWIVGQVNKVYDTSSTTYQNLVDALESDPNANFGGGADSDWVLSQIPAVPSNYIDSDYIEYEIDNIPSSKIRWDRFASLVALPPYGTDRFTGMFAYVESENRGYVASTSGWIPLAFQSDIQNVDIQADSEWILNNITNDDIQWIAYPTLGDLPSASTNHGMFAHVHAEGRGYFAHANAWVPLARLDDLDNLEIKADSEWILRQIPTVKADSEWILKQIPEVKVDSDYVLRISNPEVDSDWVLRSVGVDSEYVLRVSNPEVDSEWVISQFGVLSGPRVSYEINEEYIGGSNAGSLSFTVDGGGTNKINSITPSGISAAWVTIEPNPTYWPIPVPETFIIINDQVLAQFDDPGSALTTFSVNGTPYFKGAEETGTDVILQPSNEAIPIKPYGLSLGLTGRKKLTFETVAVDQPADIDSEIKVAIKNIVDIMQIMDSEIHDIYVQATRPENEADSDWVTRQISRADSDWTLRQIHAISNPQVDSEWVLGISNPEADSEWILSVTNPEADSDWILSIANPEVDSEWVLSVSNPEVDSDWTINKLPTFFNMDYGTYT